MELYGGAKCGFAFGPFKVPDNFFGGLLDHGAQPDREANANESLSNVWSRKVYWPRAGYSPWFVNLMNDPRAPIALADRNELSRW